ncbi:MAG TPA: hypothetical protein VNX25_06655, partial [Verrucomicrobiae bacterium]|nr:hypothetical protein [Verrucomicrobiae bacterium]
MKFDRSLAAAVIILMAVFLPLHVAMHAAVHVGLQKPGGKPWVVEKGALTPHSDEDTSGVSVCLPDLAL